MKWIRYPTLFHIAILSHGEMKADLRYSKLSLVSSKRNRSSRGCGYTTDDDINSVDGGPPSEASDDDDS